MGTISGGVRPSIRPMRKADNPAVAAIIREVMTEFGAVGDDYSIADPEVDAMFEAYPSPDSAFFVVEQDGQVLGCGGMGPLQAGPADVCELRKMYFLPDLRGTGMGTKLLAVILEAARQAGHQRCYLETLGNMSEARRLYLKHGFEPMSSPLGSTGHSGCNAWMIRDL